jgi:hypothetical protein
MSTTATKLNERNYRQWATEAKALLRAQGLWKYVSGEMGVPMPPSVATSDVDQKRRKTMDLYMKEREGKTQCRLPNP